MITGQLPPEHVPTVSWVRVRVRVRATVRVRVRATVRVRVGVPGRVNDRMYVTGDKCAVGKCPGTRYDKVLTISDV